MGKKQKNGRLTQLAVGMREEWRGREGTVNSSKLGETCGEHADVHIHRAHGDFY